ncbi:hypothetical protein O6H91_16G007900 [Diphasiastrum complanatum]|nr:hypothetical protein O6H91_16G007900 [Diphasiastrum complanatum]
MGFVVAITKEKPPVEELCCVRDDLADQGVADQCLWAPSKPMGCFFQSSPQSIWTVKPQIVRIDAKGVSVGAFSCLRKTTEKNSLPIAILRNVHLNLEAMPNLEQVQHQIEKHAPIVFFHPEETFLPCSVAWFFDNGALLHSRSSTSPSKVLSDGCNLPQGGSNDGEYWLDLPEDATAAEVVKKGNLASAEAYIHVKPMHGGAFTDMAFWIFCPFNGGGVAKVGRMTLALGKLGQHVSDWEHFTLRVSNLSGKLTRIYLSQHRCGAWVHPWELQWESGRPIVYSGKGGHSSYHLQGYNLQGTEKLRFGLLNSTARSDYSFDTSAKYQIVSAEYLGLNEPPWLQFMREWGPKVAYSTKVKMDAIAKALPTSKARSSVQGFSHKLPKIFYGEEGPTGPKQKNNWYGDERVASS